MELYTRLCIESTFVALVTIGLHLWTFSSPPKDGPRIDLDWVYFALAAPTLVLIHHLTYFLTKGVFTFSEPTLPPYERLHQAISNDPIVPVDETLFETSEEEQLPPYSTFRDQLELESEPEPGKPYNPFISSVPAVVLLLLITILVGGLGLSALIAASVDRIDSIARQKAVNHIAALAQQLTPLLPSDVSSALSEELKYITPLNATRVMELYDLSSVGQLAEELQVFATQGGYVYKDGPGAGLLMFQGVLSLIQTGLLGTMCVFCFRTHTPPSFEDEEEEKWEDIEYV